MLISVQIPAGNRWQKVGTEENLVKELFINIWADIRETSKGWGTILGLGTRGRHYCFEA